LAAARAAFRRDTYDRASVRQIAREADVDPALIRHYFGDKGSLFLASARIAFDPRRIMRLLAASGRDGFGRRVVRSALLAWESPPGTTMARALAAHPGLYRVVGQLASEEMAVAAATVLADMPDAERRVRTAMLEAIMSGLFTGRYIARLEPLASLPPEVVVERFGPIVQDIVDGGSGT
jgi:AcrR family transcriptional regulator